MHEVVRALALAFLSLPLLAQTGYKYRDANGQWVFTDHAAPAQADETSFSLQHQSESLHSAVERRDTGNSTQLTAINDCLCVATFQVKITRSDDPDIANGTEYRETLAAGSQHPMVRIVHANAGKPDFHYVWRVGLGLPGAEHHPPTPYRVPFALGSTYRISQAYPDKFTHGSEDSTYAVDIALPDGTPVYAAREGVVINVHHDSFRVALAPVMLDQANVVEILHDDGTIAIYAHLHWDSIRVHIGEQVARGLYIANSGNTGFSSGPHLHFAVVRNAGETDVSVPVVFAGARGTEVTPATGMRLTAY